MASKEVYTVTLDNKAFEYATRWRNGIEFARGETKVLELTKEEVENFKNDRYFSIQEGEVEATNADEGEETLESGADTGADQKDAQSGPQADEAQDSDEEKEDSDELTALLQNSREVLNTMATDLGIEAAAELPNKPAVAEAIIAKRG